MPIKKIALVSVLVLTSLPIFAYADIYITNNTDSYATGILNGSPCSATAGSSGIINPHQADYDVPQLVVATICKGTSDCSTDLYMTKDCSGKIVASATVDAKKGITHVTNFDEKNYVVTAKGSTVTINTASKSWKSWFNFL